MFCRYAIIRIGLWICEFLPLAMSKQFCVTILCLHHACRFNTSLGALIYSDQFLQISNSLPSKYIYGLGEHVDELLHNVNWTRLTLFSRDQFPGVSEFV